MKRFGIAVAIAAMVALPWTGSIAAMRPAVVLSTAPSTAQHSYSGTLLRRRHLVLTIRLPSGKPLVVDATEAYLQKRVTGSLLIGDSVTAQGNLIAGVLIASSAVSTRMRFPRQAPDR
jgi:hypothetical protein